MATAEIVPPAKKLPESVEIATTPMQLIQMAVQQGADVERLEKLLDLQLRWEANEARKLFVVAMNAFKAAPPTITKNRHVTYKEVDYWHATLDNVVDSIGAAMSKHGISHRWKTGQVDGKISVTCVLTHEAGHSEETTLTAGADVTGSKNAIQAIASTVRYLQRYTLLSATGLAEKGDDDGKTGGMEDQGFEDYLSTIRDASTPDECQSAFKKAYVAAGELSDKESQKAFITAKDTRQRELREGRR